MDDDLFMDNISPNDIFSNALFKDNNVSGWPTGVYRTLEQLFIPNDPGAGSQLLKGNMYRTEIQPFGNNPAPRTLTPNMLIFAPALSGSYPDVYSEHEVEKGLKAYALSSDSDGQNAQTHSSPEHTRDEGEQGNNGSDSGAPQQNGDDHSEAYEKCKDILDAGRGCLWASKGNLQYIDKNGNFQGAYPYTSGEAGVTDPSVKDRGPIPKGGYSFDTKDISGAEGIRYLGRRLTGDWGHFRVPLTPDEGTDMHGRGGMYIHGGDTPGSKGCIDVGGHEAILFPRLRESGGIVGLTVTE